MQFVIDFPATMLVVDKTINVGSMPFVIRVRGHVPGKTTDASDLDGDDLIVGQTVEQDE